MNARLLGIDYGRKHVGLAIATTPLAEPLETVATVDSIEKITKLVKENQLSAIILGISENEMAKRITEFGKQLLDHTDCLIYLHDETLSSHITRKKMAKAGAKKSKREAKIDHLVAAAILQDFMDSYASLDEVPETAILR